MIHSIPVSDGLFYSFALLSRRRSSQAFFISSSTMATQDKVRLITDVIEGLNLSIDCVAQSLSDRPRPGQKSTRGTASIVQQKEIANAYTTMLGVQAKLHLTLRELQADTRPLRPEAVHTGMTHHQAITAGFPVDCSSTKN